MATDILAYLVEHPNAEDTLQGILEWWLLEQQIKKLTAEVQTALAELVTQNLMLEREGRDGQIHYRLNRRRLGEIRTLIARKVEPVTSSSNDELRGPS